MTGSSPQAYIDESGSHDESPVYVLSGFRSTVEKWAEFALEWRKVLYAKPRIEYFHFNEVFRKNRGEFASFDDADRFSKVHLLIKVINKYAEEDCSVVMNHKAYKRILEPMLPKTARDPYLFVFSGVLAGFAFLESHAIHKEKIRFVFDEKDSLANAIPLWDDVRNATPLFQELNQLIGDLKPEDDKIFLPLQAADLLAGVIRQQHSGLPQVPGSEHFWAALREPKRLGPFIYPVGDERLGEIARDFRNIEGEIKLRKDPKWLPKKKKKR